MLKTHAIPAFKDNYIWFIQASNSQHVLIVDPGDALPVLDALKQSGLIPIAILITHGCHDHVNGINALLEQYDIPVYGPKNEFIPSITHPLSACEDVKVSVNFPVIQVLDIPGHTKGHIGFLVEGMLFCGDALFGAGCGRLHSGPAEVMFQSLKKIAQLPASTLIYCAHEYTEANLRFAATIEPENGDIKLRIKDTRALRQQSLPSLPSNLESELKTNPFLRCEQEAVKQATEKRVSRQLDSAQAVFTVLRQWKDVF